MRCQFGAPHLNAFAERFVQSIRFEALDHFICFGIDHLHHIVNKFVAFYNQHRPHQGRDNRTLPAASGDGPDSISPREGKVECQQELGGLLKHYYRRAA